MARERRLRLLRWVLGLATLGVATAYGAFRTWPESFRSKIARAHDAYSRGDWSQAATLASERLRDAPDDRDALRILARAAARRQQDDVARRAFGRLGGAATMQAEDFYLLGTMIRRLGDRESARLAWETGLRSDRKHPELLRDLAEDYLALGRYAQAAQLARPLAQCAGWQARGQFLLGRILYEQGDFPEAAAALRLGMTLDPRAEGMGVPVRDLRTLLARALLRSGQPAEASKCLSVLGRTVPDLEASWLALCASLQSGEWRRSDDALASGRSYRADHPLEPEPAPFVGAATCAKCHREKYRTQQASLHARTFHRADDLPSRVLHEGPLSDPANGSVRHTLVRGAKTVRYEAADGPAIDRALVEFAFGSGDRGLTLVGRDGRGLERELRLSYYADVGAWDVTSGHPSRPPELEGYLGRLLAPDDVFGCLKCHTTDPFSAKEGKGAATADRGIGCERCHGPGKDHLAAVEAGQPDLGIARPALVSGAPIVSLCAGCHSPSGGKELRRDDPAAVRFQGTTLTWSRCYLESKGRFDCVTCHNPHRDAQTSASFYEAKCLSCHSERRDQLGEEPARVVARACPVDSRRGCLDCHMLRVAGVVPHSTFTDHFIRVRPRLQSAGGTSNPPGRSGP